MYWLANSGTNRSATAMMPAAAYSAAIARPRSSRTPSERRNGGISSRQKARKAPPYLTRMPTLSSARFVASKVTAATAPATRRPIVTGRGGHRADCNRGVKGQGREEDGNDEVRGVVDRQRRASSLARHPTGRRARATPMAGSRPVNMIASRMGRLPPPSVTRSDTSTDISSAITARMAKTTASRMTVDERRNRSREAGPRTRLRARRTAPGPR